LVTLTHTFTKNLTLTDADLTLSNDHPAPGHGVIISATVHNTGDLPLDRVAVGFYDGDPTAGGALIGTSTLTTTLAAGFTTTLTMPYTVPSTGGSHMLYAVADPYNAIPESDKNDNTGKLMAFGPDLDLNQAGVDYWAGKRVGLQTVIGNIGTSTTPMSTLNFYRDTITGTLIATNTVPSLMPGQSITVTTPYTYGTLATGTYQIVAAVNQTDFSETFRANNAYTFTLNVAPDLAVSPYYLWATSLPNGQVAITATVYNFGSVTAPPANIALYADIPFSHTTEITNSILPSLDPASATTFTATWTPSTNVPHTIYVAVNQTQTITETTYSNNLASIDITSTGSSGTPTPTSTITPTNTLTATATQTPTSTASPMPTNTPVLLTPTDTATPNPSASPTSTPSATMTPTNTPTPSPTVTPTRTPKPPTITPTPSATITPTDTPTTPSLPPGPTPTSVSPTNTAVPPSSTPPSLPAPSSTTQPPAAATATTRPLTGATPTSTVGPPSRQATPTSQPQPTATTTTVVPARCVRPQITRLLVGGKPFKAGMQVSSGQVIGVTVHAAPHTHVRMTITLTGVRVVMVDRGGRRERVTRVVTVEQLAVEVTTNGHGDATGETPIVYAPAKAEAVALTVAARVACGGTATTKPLTLRLQPACVTPMVSMHLPDGASLRDGLNMPSGQTVVVDVDAAVNTGVTLTARMYPHGARTLARQITATRVTGRLDGHATWAIHLLTVSRGQEPVLLSVQARVRCPVGKPHDVSVTRSFHVVVTAASRKPRSRTNHGRTVAP